MSEIIWAGSKPQDRNVVGGKGENLLRLHHAALQLKSFEVPNFYVIPLGYDERRWNDLANAFNRLKHPVAVRSSSPLEDGVNASFAGMFKSFLNISSFDEFQEAYHHVLESSNNKIVERYAKTMGVNMDYCMGVIVQEQVVNPWLRGTIQLDDESTRKASFRCEFKDRKGRPDNYEQEIEFLKEVYDNTTHKLIHHPRNNTEHLVEYDYLALVKSAFDARKALELEGVVQVECCFSPDKPISLVQIRQLPNVSSTIAELDLTIPDGVPYIESDVCNDISGELILPAYVTTSQTGLNHLLTFFGYGLGYGKDDEERIERFRQKSRLAYNHDLDIFKTLAEMERFEGLEKFIRYYNGAWQIGNELFNQYVLVCDKLNESYIGMAELTTNKKAIITCLEADKTSHAMTVARDLGIMCMGVEGHMDVLEPKFFHQIETGDMIHMKSDGRKAVAYIEKKRVSDPYTKK